VLREGTRLPPFGRTARFVHPISLQRQGCARAR